MSTIQIKNFTGPELRLFRKLHSLSQKDLSQILGLSQSAISLYESSRQPVTPEIMEILHRKYPQDDLFQVQSAPQYPQSFLLHRAVMVHYLEKYVQDIQTYTPEQLYSFEDNILQLSAEHSSDSSDCSFFQNFPYLFTCEDCKEAFGCCQLSQLEDAGHSRKSTNDICKELWIQYLNKIE